MIGNHRILAISSLFTSAFLYAEASVVTNFTTTKTDPTNISIPNIPQTTSYDVATECTYYTSPYTINQAEWPTIWDIATTNGMNTSQEFQNLYNSINWSQAPNIQVRTMSAAGGLDMTGYDTVNDPDCWWSATQCVKPKHQGINPDISACPEPETWGLVSSLSSFFSYILSLFLPFYAPFFFVSLLLRANQVSHLFRLMMMDPTVRTMRSMTFCNKTTKRRPCSISARMFSTGLTVHSVVWRTVIILRLTLGLIDRWQPWQIRKFWLNCITLQRLSNMSRVSLHFTGVR